MLSVEEHKRDSAQMRYIYPVLSRRAGGVSLGINLNTNRACNWACVYCQVENLTRGKPEKVDFLLLEKELRAFLKSDFLEKNAPPGAHLKDIAFSGDGEPTALAQFDEAVRVVKKIVEEFSLPHLILRLITNGSFLDQVRVLKVLPLLDEIWFKLDRADDSTKTINGIPFNLKKTQKRLEAALSAAPTFIQTCWFLSEVENADENTLKNYLLFLKPYAPFLKGVYLYGLARMPARNSHLKRLPWDELKIIGNKIECALGLKVQVVE